MNRYLPLLILAATSFFATAQAQSLKTDDPIGRFLFANISSGKVYLGYYCLKREATTEGKQDCAQAQFVTSGSIDFERDYLGNITTRENQWTPVGPILSRENSKQIFDQAKANGASDAITEVWAGLWNWEAGWQDHPLKVSAKSLEAFIALLGASQNGAALANPIAAQLQGWWNIGGGNYLLISGTNELKIQHYYQGTSMMMRTSQMEFHLTETIEGSQAISIDAKNGDVTFMDSRFQKKATIHVNDKKGLLEVKVRGVYFRTQSWGYEQNPKQWFNAVHVTQEQINKDFYFAD